MSKAKATLPFIVSIVVLVAITVIALQYKSYFELRHQLLQDDEKNRRFLREIEPTRKSYSSFSRDLAELEQRNVSLRRQLPEKLQLEAFKAEVEEQCRKHGLEVLALREAHLNRSSYQEVRFSFSLKGQMNSVQQLVKYLESQPRLVKIKGPETESKENVGLVISIFSVKADSEEPVAEPKCLGKHDTLLFPFLNEELDLLYSDYQRICDELKNESGLYADMQRQQQLTASVRTLEQILKSLLSKSP